MAIFSSMLVLIYCTYLFIKYVFSILNLTKSLQAGISSTLFTYLNKLSEFMSNSFSLQIKINQSEYYLKFIQYVLEISSSFQSSLKTGIIVVEIFVITVFLISFLNILKKFKTDIIKGRKSKKILDKYKGNEIANASEIIGNMIGCTVVSFFIISILFSIILGILFSTYFWIFVWEYRLPIFILLVPNIIDFAISFLLTKIIFEEDTIVHSFVIQLFDIYKFVMSLIDGIVASISKIIIGLLYLCIGMIIFEKNLLPRWINSQIPFLNDNVARSINSLIQIHLKYSNPIFEIISLDWKNHCSKFKSSKIKNKLYKAYIYYKFTKLYKS